MKSYRHVCVHVCVCTRKYIDQDEKEGKKTKRLTKHLQTNFPGLSIYNTVYGMRLIYDRTTDLVSVCVYPRVMKGGQGIMHTNQLLQPTHHTQITT